MFIIIEGDTVYKVDEITPEHVQANTDGKLQVINCLCMTYLSNWKWLDIGEQDDNTVCG